MEPFFCYYGGKWRIARRYPSPAHDLVVEPFAGAAGYATRYADRRVVLCDRDPLIVALWSYLIRVSSAEVMALPASVSHVDDVPGPEEARWLIGFWLNKGTAQPRKQPSAWMRAGNHSTSQWGVAIRDRIARQVEQIRHWSVVLGSYECLADVEATWFVDPPYVSEAGRHYRFNEVDFDALARWCESRTGRTIVCEQSGATWLPFEELGGRGRIKTNAKRFGYEAVWVSDGQDFQLSFG